MPNNRDIAKAYIDLCKKYLERTQISLIKDDMLHFRVYYYFYY